MQCVSYSVSEMIRFSLPPPFSLPFPFSPFPFPYLHTNVFFSKYAHNSGPRGSPDMILTAFDAKFHEKKDQLPPEARNPQTKITKTQKNKKCNPKWIPQTLRPLGRPCRGSGGRQPPGKCLKSFRHQYEAAQPLQVYTLPKLMCADNVVGG